jgi:hypothetical protein
MFEYIDIVVMMTCRITRVVEKLQSARDLVSTRHESVSALFYRNTDSDLSLEKRNKVPPLRSLGVGRIFR